MPRTKSAVKIIIPHIGTFKRTDLVEVYSLSGTFEGYIQRINQGAKSFVFKDEADEDEFNIRTDHVTAIRHIEGREGFITKKEQREYLEDIDDDEDIPVQVAGENEKVEWFREDDDFDDEEDDDFDDFDEDLDDDEYYEDEDRHSD